MELNSNSISCQPNRLWNWIPIPFPANQTDYGIGFQFLQDSKFLRIPIPSKTFQHTKRSLRVLIKCQVSRSWNLHFDERIKEFGFAKSEFEPCVYTKFSGSIVTFLVLYVDDILLIGNDVPTLQSAKNWLSKCFQMKDLGEAAYILGIKIYRYRSKRLIGLSQSTYIDKILKKFRMDESKK
ncbi:hypothetical protein OSB04_031682 [Centaurea solstitialis]|uniref:Reverse transcriptase Ty1/copia-type domain-containing protein n=1 Tax=Centaurea solstitialis TaxID=347529 RepID=A0AA38S9F9_9ASTR|nr:hypothetical protein OSB04_031682 [Centaurea solstitialis]